MDRSESESGSGSSSTLESGMETVILLKGESILIPCDVSSIATPSTIDWYQNGTLTTSNTVCLEIYSRTSLI